LPGDEGLYLADRLGDDLAARLRGEAAQRLPLGGHQGGRGGEPRPRGAPEHVELVEVGPPRVAQPGEMVEARVEEVAQPPRLQAEVAPELVVERVVARSRAIQQVDRLVAPLVEPAPEPDGADL